MNYEGNIFMRCKKDKMNEVKTRQCVPKKNYYSSFSADAQIFILSPLSYTCIFIYFIVLIKRE
jgi:hypothetical protein